MQPNQTIFYVKDVAASVKLYSELLNSSPVKDYPEYACFKLNSGFLLGFWDVNQVKPATASIASTSELLFALPSKEAVDQCLAKWQQTLTIIQTPETLCFGYTFTAIDTDNNRLRVYTENL